MLRRAKACLGVVESLSCLPASFVYTSSLLFCTAWAHVLRVVY